MALKMTLILFVVLVFTASVLAAMQTGIHIIVFIGVAAIFALIWYWPRFKIEWEYVFCDGQLDFDMIQGANGVKIFCALRLRKRMLSRRFSLIVWTGIVIWR